MKRLAAILLLAGCASVTDLRSGDPAAAIWSRYADGVDDAEVSVGVVKDGVPTFAGNPGTIYRIGQLTDFFVLEAVRRLADRGEIDLDRPVTAYARFAIDPLYGRVTLRDLAELRSEWIDDDGLDFLSSRYPWASDRRIALLTALVENATGHSVDEIVSNEVVIPLGLRDTGFALAGDKVSRLESRCDDFDGLYASVEDCVRFFASSDRVRSPTLLAKHTFGGISLEYRIDRCWGARRVLIFPKGSRDFMVIFRNRTSWMQYRDLESAAEVFVK